MFLNRKIALSALLSIIASPGLPAIVLSTLSAPAIAQFANTTGRTVMIPAGTTFEGRMDKTVSSNHSHAGDRFNVVLSSPLLANGSDVLVPAGTQVIGEVVEAISSGHQPHEKKQKLNGKLRVQITALRTPDGTTYPLVGSFIGETTGKGNSKKANPDLGTGIAYVGSTANFNAVYPNSNQRSGGNRRGPQLVTRKQMMEDPLYGDPDKKSQNGPAPTIRSLVKDHHELVIHEGSPMSIRLDAPLKMAIAPIGGMTPSAFNENAPQEPARPNFSRPRSAIAAPPSPAADAQQQAPPQAPAAPISTGPSFLEPAPGSRAPMIPPPQAQMQTQMQPQSFAPPAGMPQTPPAGGGWFRPSGSPADQAAAAQATPSFSPAPPAAQAAPSAYNTFGAAPQAPPTAPAAAAPAQSWSQPVAPPATPPPAQAQVPVQSSGALNAAPAQPAAAQSLFGDSTPAKGAPATPPAAQAAAPAQSLGALGTSAPSAASAAPSGALHAAPASALPSTAGSAAAPAALSLPAVASPTPPEKGQSLDSFINSLGSPAGGSSATAPASKAP